MSALFLGDLSFDAIEEQSVHNIVQYYGPLNLGKLDVQFFLLLSLFYFFFLTWPGRSLVTCPGQKRREICFLLLLSIHFSVLNL